MSAGSYSTCSATPSTPCASASRRASPATSPSWGVRTVVLNHQVHIQVTDNGMGMSPAVQAKIFQPFFTTKPAGEGTGLGLSLSHDIIAQGHGGSLAVESQEGAGTTFSVALPLNSAAHQRAS